MSEKEEKSGFVLGGHSADGKPFETTFIEEERGPSIQEEVAPPADKLSTKAYHLSDNEIAMVSAMVSQGIPFDVIDQILEEKSSEPPSTPEPEIESRKTFVDGKQVREKNALELNGFRIELDDKEKNSELRQYARFFKEAYEAKDVEKLKELLHPIEVKSAMSDNRTAQTYESLASNLFVKKIKELYDDYSKDLYSDLVEIKDIEKEEQIILLKLYDFTLKGDHEGLANSINEVIETSDKKVETSTQLEQAMSNNIYRLSEYGSEDGKEKCDCKHFSTILSDMLFEADIEHGVITNSMLTSKDDYGFTAHIALVSKTTGNIFEATGSGYGAYRLVLAKDGNFEKESFTAVVVNPTDSSTSIYTNNPNLYNAPLDVMPARFVLFQADHDLKPQDGRVNWRLVRDSASENLHKFIREANGKNTLEVKEIAEHIYREIQGHLSPPEVFENAGKAVVIDESELSR